VYGIAVYMIVNWMHGREPLSGAVPPLEAYMLYRCTQAWIRIRDYVAWKRDWNGNPP